MLRVFAEMIDAKDCCSAGQSLRVAEYAGEIAKRAGFSVRQQTDIYMAALLHDVGKLGVPDEIITKNTSLTEEEMDIIREHPAAGAKVLEQVREHPGLAAGARWHHERYEGGGYPDGLVGENIPDEARIIAVADAYAAMTSKRSYRDRLPREAVREELERGKGTQFDPAYADIMIALMQEGADGGLYEE
jgi:putative two-component system response regulator